MDSSPAPFQSCTIEEVNKNIQEEIGKITFADLVRRMGGPTEQTIKEEGGWVAEWRWENEDILVAGNRWELFTFSFTADGVMVEGKYLRWT